MLFSPPPAAGVERALGPRAGSSHLSRPALPGSGPGRRDQRTSAENVLLCRAGLMRARGGVDPRLRPLGGVEIGASAPPPPPGRRPAACRPTRRAVTPTRWDGDLYTPRRAEPLRRDLPSERGLTAWSRPFWPGPAARFPVLLLNIIFHFKL